MSPKRCIPPLYGDPHGGKNKQSSVSCPSTIFLLGKGFMDEIVVEAFFLELTCVCVCSPSTLHASPHISIYVSTAAEVTREVRRYLFFFLLFTYFTFHLSCLLSILMARAVAAGSVSSSAVGHTRYPAPDKQAGRRHVGTQHDVVHLLQMEVWYISPVLPPPFLCPSSRALFCLPESCDMLVETRSEINMKTFTSSRISCRLVLSTAETRR